MGYLDQEEQIAKEGILVLTPNWPVFALFLACSRQWDTLISPAGQLIRMGMKWDQVEVRARHMPEVRALDEEETDQLWRDLTIMQNHALEAFAEQHNE